DIRGIRNARLSCAIDTSALDSFQDFRFQPVTEGCETVKCAIHNRLHSNFGGLTEPDDSGYVFGSGATLALVSAPEEKRLKLRAAAYIEDSGALRRVKFVSGDAEEIAAYDLHVDGRLGGGLHRVGVEPDISFLGNAADFPNRLNGSGFVVRHHHANQAGVGAEGAANLIGIDSAIRANRQERDFKTALCEPFRGMEYGVVLDGRCNDVVAGLDQPKGCQVIALSST